MISLRFQRKNTTVFLFAESTDTFQTLKVKLVELLGEKDPKEVRLYAADKETEYKDLAVASDFALTDGALVHVVIGGEGLPA